MSEEIPPSQTEVNQAVRVLSGKTLKYTCRVYKADGSVIEWQSDNRIKLMFHVEARALWVCGGDYSNDPIMPYQDGMIMFSEENPK